MDDDKIKVRVKTAYTDVTVEDVSLKSEFTKDEFLDMLREKKLLFDGLWYYFNNVKDDWTIERVAVARVDQYKRNNTTVIEEIKNEVEITNG